MIEVSFSQVPQGWAQTLESLPDVATVKESEGVFRISTNNGPRTTVALMEAARNAELTLSSLSVQSTTLDDVFVHYTGHQLRDTLQAGPGYSSEFMYQGKN
jgi:ABC-2 type transport system ATP-binding protein